MGPWSHRFPLRRPPDSTQTRCVPALRVSLRPQPIDLASAMDDDHRIRGNRMKRVPTVKPSTRRTMQALAIVQGLLILVSLMVPITAMAAITAVSPGPRPRTRWPPGATRPTRSRHERRPRPTSRGISISSISRPAGRSVAPQLDVRERRRWRLRQPHRVIATTGATAGGTYPDRHDRAPLDPGHRCLQRR